MLRVSAYSTRPSLNNTSLCNNSASTGRNSIKLDIYAFFEKSAEKIQLSLKFDKNNEYFTWRLFHIYNNILLNSP